MVKHEPVDPEVLAALLDGGLSAAERDEAFQRLSRSQGDYEALVEAIRIRRDLEADAQAAPAGPAPAPQKHAALPGRPRRRWPVGRAWWRLAAVIAGVLLVPRVLQEVRTAPTPLGLLDGATLVQSPGDGTLAASLGAGWDQPEGGPWRRGGSPLPSLSQEFHSGMRLADLEVALDAGDVTAARRIAPELISLLAQSRVPGPLVADYQRISARAHERSRHFADDRARAATALTRYFHDSPSFGLGLWVEQARLATLANRAGFFDARATRALEPLVDRLARQQGPGTPVVSELRRLQRVIDSGASPGDLEPIREHLDAVIRESSS